jgi:hypothetical protein
MRDESKQYIVKNDAQVIELLDNRVSADAMLNSTSNSYLRMLIATAQSQLGISDTRKGKAHTDETIRQHIEAIAQVHKRFYEVLSVHEKSMAIEAEDKRERYAISASRLAFARSSYSTIRSWLERGRNTLHGVLAAKVTKRSLYEQTPRRDAATAAETIASGVVRVSNKLYAQIAKESDTAQRLEMLKSVVNIFSHGFDTLGIDSQLLRYTVDQFTLPVVVDNVSQPRMRNRSQIRAVS